MRIRERLRVRQADIVYDLKIDAIVNTSTAHKKRMDKIRFVCYDQAVPRVEVGCTELRPACMLCI
jgi:hypothetical protein